MSITAKSGVKLEISDGAVLENKVNQHILHLSFTILIISRCFDDNVLCCFGQVINGPEDI